MTQEHVNDAMERVLAAALRVLSAERALGSSDPHADAQHEYASEQLGLAARALTHATDALSPERQPVGWRDTATASAL
jgi:hypothetical protein